MYKIKIDSDDMTVQQKIITAKQLIELVGDEPNDCNLVSSESNIIFNGNVDLSRYRTFQTMHPDFIPSSWCNEY